VDSIEVITYVIKQSGYCNFCNRKQENIWYVFCDSKCRDFYLSLEGEQMGEFDIDKDLYIKWFEEKTVAIESMTKEDIEQRIKEVFYIEFYCKREGAMLSQQWDKLSGRHGIPEWIKKDRDKLITDPNIKVNWEGEPRKKEKKPKDDLISDLFGMSIKEMRQKVKEQNGGFVAPEKQEKKQSLNEALEQMAMSMGERKVEPLKLTPEEMKAKADAVKEKIRLAKEKREKGE